VSAVTEAICKALQADAQLQQLAPGGVWPFVAPEKTPFPYVIVSTQSPAVDHYTFGGPNSGWREAVYLVKAVDQNLSPADAEDIRSRVHTVLQDANLTVSGESVLWLRRRSQFPEYTEIVDGLVYVHRGALYDVVTE